MTGATLQAIELSQTVSGFTPRDGFCFGAASAPADCAVAGTSFSINAALPLVTVAGLQFGLLLGGAIITETVFALPGVGRLIVGAIRQLDFPIVQAGVFLFALIVVLVNFAVDLLYIYLNPQIRVR